LPIIIKIASKELVDNGIGLLSASKIQIAIQENVINEAHILKHLTQTNKVHSVVQFVDFFSDARFYFLIMSDGGQSLHAFIEQCHEWIAKNQLDIKHWLVIVQHIFKQLVELMDVLHNKLHVCHSDLSLQNVLIQNVDIGTDRNGKIEISPHFQINLCDFGSARIFDDDDAFQSDRYVGKTRYVSPELFAARSRRNGRYDARANDMWSMAVCLFVCCVGHNPYNSPCDIDYQFGLIQKGKLEQLLLMMDKHEYVTPDALDLMRRVFAKEQDRITVQEMKRHSFLQF